MGQVYSNGYLKDNIITAADRVIKIIAAHGINGHAAALRWAAHHSKLDANSGDAVIIAASSVAQLHTNIDAIEEGPLPDEVVQAMNGIHGDVAGSEFPYHF
jgi:aflatoxin B1 aldehyde reductase